MLENWFILKLDYLSVWYGACFLLLTTISFLLHLNQKSEKTCLPWDIFSWFSVSYCAHIWTKVAQLAYRNVTCLDYIYNIFLLTSLVLLYEFSRRGSKKQGIKNYFSRRFIIFLLVISSICLLFDSSWFFFAFIIVVGIPAISQTAILFWQLAQKINNPRFKKISVVFAIFGFLKFVTIFFMIDKYEYSVNISENIFSISVFAVTAFSVWLTYLFWGYAKTVISEQNIIFKEYYFPSALLLLFLAGFGLIEWRCYMVDFDMRNDLILAGNGITRTLNDINLENLTFTTEDKKLADSEIISRQLSLLLNASKDAGFDAFYFLAKRDGKYYFGPQSSIKSNNINTLTGSVYEQFNDLLDEIMETGISKTVTPYKDNYGEHVSGFIPLVLPKYDKPFCILGIDMHGEKWRISIEKKRAALLLQLMVLMAFPVGSIFYVLKRKKQGDLNIASTIPWASLSIVYGILITSFIVVFAYNVTMDNLRHNFYTLADGKAHNIVNTFNTIKRELYCLKLFLTKNGAFKAFNEFSFFSKTVASPAVSRNWKWISVVEKNKIADYEKKVRQESGFENYKVVPFNGQRTKFSFYNYSYCFPVLYSYPEANHKRTMGWDYSFEKFRSEAISRCIKTKMPSVIFPSDYNFRHGEKGMFVMVPIDTDNDEQIDKILMQIIPVGEIIDGVLSSRNYNDEYIDFDIIDLEQEKGAQFLAGYPNTNKPGEKVQKEGFKYIAPIFAFGKTMAVSVRPNASFFVDQDVKIRTFATVVAGLTITGLLALFINFLQNRHKDLEKLVNERADKIFKQEMLIKTISDNMPVVAFRCTADEKWDFSFLSSEVKNLLGVSPSVILNGEKSYASFVFHEDLTSLVNTVTNAVRNHLAYDIEYRVVAFGRSIKWVNERGYVVSDSDGTPLWIDGSISDVTTRHEAIVRLNESLAELGKANAELQIQKTRADQFAEEARNANYAKGRFLANMSHEIRTPMNAIIGMCNLVKETSLDATQKNYVDLICASSENLLALINDILDFSKLDAGKMQLENIGFKLTKCIDNCIKMMSVRASEKSIVLDCTYEDDVPLFLYGDPTRLGQVMLNLLGNAIKFTESGCVTVKISVAKKYGSDVVLKFVVSDTGIGISQKDISGLFDAFAQANNTISRKFGGTGLGLAISKQIVEMFKGEIGVESVLGKGSDFWFTARFTVQDHVEVIGADSDSNAMVVNAVMDPESKLSKKILLVEDNEINQQVAIAILNKLGFRADVASDGVEAVKILEEKPYDLVLMDCQMPGMNGYEATSYLRHGRAGLLNTHVTIIAMTANVLAGDKKKCLDAGMNDYIGKPVRPNQLLEKLEKWLTADKDLFSKKSEEEDTAAQPKPDERESREGISQGEKEKTAEKTETKPAVETSVADENTIAKCLRGVDKSVIDRVELTSRMMGDDAMIRRILDTFDNVASGIVETLRFAVEAENYDLAREQAHSLKGAAANISATKLRELAAELEGYYRNNDYGKVSECFTRLEAAYELLVKELL